MTIYRSSRNIVLMAPDADVRAVWSEYDPETKGFLYRLTPEEAAKYGPALEHEGAVKDPNPAA